MEIVIIFSTIVGLIWFAMFMYEFYFDKQQHKIEQDKKVKEDFDYELFDELNKKVFDDGK